MYQRGWLAIGLTETEDALRRWMVGGPEVVRILQEFETSFGNDDESSTPHHDESPSRQKAFISDVDKLSNRLKDIGNRFNEESGD